MAGGPIGSGMDRLHTRAAIIATGDELAIGQALNTNTMWLADRLMAAGIETVEHVILGDDRGAVAAAIGRLAGAAPLVVVTGGLGPTLDDVTRDALATAAGEEMVLDEAAVAAIGARLRRVGREMTEYQRMQAMRPRSAVCLPNDNGTAPGLHMVVRGGGGGGGAEVFCLPGPPRELKPMFEREVLPRLRPDPGRTSRTLVLHAAGIFEAEAADRLGELMDRGRNPLVGITVSGGGLAIRIRAAGAAGEGLDRALAETGVLVRERLGPYIYGSGDETLESVVLGELRRAGATLACVESCTGGGLGAAVTRVAGASDVFLGGWVTYSNDLKERLVGVPADLLRRHGAVSEPVARAMAVGGLERSGAGFCLSVTGIAGPGGGTEEKPVGTVYIGLARRLDGAAAGAVVRRFRITGDRDDVRERSVRTALVMLLLALRSPGSLEGPGAIPLAWEVRGRSGGAPGG